MVHCVSGDIAYFGIEVFCDIFCCFKLNKMNSSIKRTLADDSVPINRVCSQMMFVALDKTKIGAILQRNLSQTQRVFRFCGGFHY